MRISKDWLVLIVDILDLWWKRLYVRYLRWDLARRHARKQAKASAEQKARPNPPA